jgi:hypothetical protein
MKSKRIIQRKFRIVVTSGRGRKLDLNRSIGGLHRFYS